MSRGESSKGFKMSKRIREFMAQGHSLEQAIKLRADSYSLNKSAMVAGSSATVSAIEPVNILVPESEADILKRLNARFEVMRKFVLACSKGQVPSVIISGPPGLGKSYETYEALAEKRHNIVKGRLSPVGLFVALFKNCERGQVLVLDDVDVFSDEKTLDMLKAATDTTGHRVISWGTSYDITDEEGNVLPKSFDYHGTLIFITNNDFRKMVETGSKIAKHLEALMSRSHYIDLGMKNKADYMVRIKYVIESAGMLEKIGIDADGKAELLDFIVNHAERFDELSLRMVYKLASMSKFDPDWKESAQVTLMKNIH